MMDIRDFSFDIAHRREEAQAGGENEAWNCLSSFLSYRGVNYSRDLSSPLAGWDGCSRISPYLTWGCISLRACYQAALRRIMEIRAMRRECGGGKSMKKEGDKSGKEGRKRTAMNVRSTPIRPEEVTDFDATWLGSLNSFTTRLRWRSHFMQKLHDEPDMEKRNLARAYDGLREGDFKNEYFTAWKDGQTGR
mmetsp:Transcript_19553/g.50084  ORF Transcript_19553/g.50084 Transcript_19553/m.50084 type:complete len:192 (-) Transcript_19553:1204-1779(-)